MSLAFAYSNFQVLSWAGNRCYRLGSLRVEKFFKLESQVAGVARFYLSKGKLSSSSSLYSPSSSSSSSHVSKGEKEEEEANKNENKYKTILLDEEQSAGKHVAHIKLNRPKAKNAFGLETAREFIEALDYCETNAAIRCVMLSGSGPDLTSGVDLKSFMGVYSELQETADVSRKAKLLLGVIEKFQQPFKRMHSFTKPIICIQHGLCYGLGMELAACSDIRYCSKDTRMSIREVLIGIAADVGSLQEMPRLVSNQSLLRELIYTGRDLRADEALDLGFVSRVLETKEAATEAALETAKLIAKRSPVAVQGSKRNLAFSRDKPFQVGLDYNAVWNASMLQADDVAKAISAVMSRSDDGDYENF